ncbi:MAG: enoyl-CoA hydratase/isomerase family protein [Anaerolineae bacterium]|nr:enoyl-CoA hydratase/isomerase family protein [Anaerolineae bacterium]
MTYETILWTVRDSVLTITLNRPEKLNAMSAFLLKELRAALEAAKGDSNIRAVVLTGAGRGFCAGADLSDVSAQMSENPQFSYRENLIETYNPIILTMREMPKPIIAAVNGVAAGAGMSLALACDVRIVAESASFLQAFVKIGLVPDSGSTWLLPRLIGVTRALELMLTGRKVSAGEALSLGMVNQVVPDTELATVVERTALELANAPTMTLGFIKQAVEFASSSTLEAALNKEAALQDLAGKTFDHGEGVAAFLSKRPPQYKGQ